jgi:hypothetical protein
MKILITIPHYYAKSSQKKHGSERSPDPRIHALSMCLFNIHSIFGKSQCMIDIHKKIAVAVNHDLSNTMDVVVSTTDNKHILEHLNIPKTYYHRHQVSLENPKNLGFECQKILKSNLGSYDFYCFMEDDLIINDAWFFEKIKWFNTLIGHNNLLQPNRFESSPGGTMLKAYIDGDIHPEATARFQNTKDSPTLNGTFLTRQTSFQRALNPHSGCFFLNQSQMAHWAKQDYFMDMDTSFISPLESSASLGIMKTFRVYKPSPVNACFLEIQHFGDQFLRLIQPANPAT